MKALRIILTQASANYRKEESDRNKMTYPLPPYSTVIGALHKACGYNSYHPMELSIQGKYESMHMEPYTDYCFLNSVMDDRGILVKLQSGELLSSAFTKVASAKKSQGNSFKKNITIQVYNQKLLEEYQSLIELRDEFDRGKKSIKDKYKPTLDEIKNQKKDLVKTDTEFKVLDQKEKEIKKEQKKEEAELKLKEENEYKNPYSLFKSLTTSLKYYEILNQVKLIIHVKADEDTLSDILVNIYNIKSIGRSEDFVEVKEASIVELGGCEEEIKSTYCGYVAYKDVINENIITKTRENNIISGTKYYLNKDYLFKNDGKTRVFNKVKVIYGSEYLVDEYSENVWVDNNQDEKYIVNFV